MVADNTKPLPVEAPDQPATTRTAATTEQTLASQRILDENRGTTNNNDATQKNGLPGTEKNPLTQPADGSDTGTATPESTVDYMMREVENTLRSAGDMVSKMLSAGISPETAAMFGNIDMFDSADSAESGTIAEAKAVDAQKANDKAEEPAKPETTDTTTGTSLSDLGNWLADAFKENVVKPVSTALSDISEVFDGATDWLFGVNDQGSQKFNDQVEATESKSQFNLDTKGPGLELPKDAVETGKVNINGNEVSVLRTPSGDTYLKHGDKVIAHQKPGGDGSYELALKDGSNLDFKLSEGSDGKYKLENMERTKDGRVQEKFVDGVMYNYNYDANGNQTSVDAAGDLKGPLSPEQLDKIKKELGNSGAAALRVTDADQNVTRLLMQVHDSDTSSLTNIDAKTAQIFNKGQEYRLDEHDHLGLVDGDGKWKAPESDDKIADQMHKLEDLAKRLSRRAQGDSTEAVDGVKVTTAPDGTATVTRENPETGEPVTTTELPPDLGRPVSITDSQGVRTDLRDGNIDMTDRDGNRLFDFDPDRGLQTDSFLADRNGLVDLETGELLKPDGTVLDEFGEPIGGSWGETFGVDSGEWSETVSDRAISTAATNQILQLGDRSLSFSCTGNPATMAAAKQLAIEAFGVANAALGALGNDLMAQIPIYSSMGLAQTAFSRADRSEQTQSYAMKMGISDASTLSELARIGTNSSTTFTPTEFVRDRAKLRLVS